MLDEHGEFGRVPGRWFEIGRVDWGPGAPDSVLLGLAGISHEACLVASYSFRDWSVLRGRSEAPLDLRCAGDEEGGVELSWRNPAGVPPGMPITVEVGGRQVLVLEGTATRAAIPAALLGFLPEGVAAIRVVKGDGHAAACGFLAGPRLFVNCGGPRLDDNLGTGVGDGRLWLEDSLLRPSPFLASRNAHAADRGGEIGAADTRLTAPEFVDDPVESRLFATERWDERDIAYAIAVPRGEFDVTLLFAAGSESYGCEDLADPSLSAGACRVVDVLVNGRRVEDQFAPQVATRRALGEPLPSPSTGAAYALGPYVAVGPGRIEVVVRDLGGGSPPENAAISGIAVVAASPQAASGFRRGDANIDAAVDISDGIAILRYLFLGDAEPSCADAADTNDSGGIDLSDGIAVFAYLFNGAAPPRQPGPDACGVDPSPDALGCQRFPPCGSGASLVPAFGFLFGDVDAGVVVGSLLPESFFASGESGAEGLREGDIIRRFNGMDVRSAAELDDVLEGMARIEEGDIAHILVERMTESGPAAYQLVVRAEPLDLVLAAQGKEECQRACTCEVDATNLTVKCVDGQHIPEALSCTITVTETPVKGTNWKKVTKKATLALQGGGTSSCEIEYHVACGK